MNPLLSINLWTHEYINLSLTNFDNLENLKQWDRSSQRWIQASQGKIATSIWGHLEKQWRQFTFPKLRESFENLAFYN